MGDCHLVFTLLPDGTFDVDIGGHLIPWTPAQMGDFRNLLVQMLQTLPPDMQVRALQIAVPVQHIIVYLSPGDVETLISEATGSLAYLETQAMREQYEGFEP